MQTFLFDNGDLSEKLKKEEEVLLKILKENKYLEKFYREGHIFKLPDKLENSMPLGLRKHKLDKNISNKKVLNKKYEIVFLFETEEERDTVLKYLNVGSKVIDGNLLKSIIVFLIKKYREGKNG